MCGIFGVSELNENTQDIIPFLAYEMEDRGRDSWGLTDGTHVHKEMGYITRNLIIPEWKTLIGHCRMTSVGKVNISNQHPFIFVGNDKKVVGIHNGTLSNYSELNKAHDRDYDVDSKHIFAHLFEGKDIKEIKGSAAIAYYDEDGNLIVGRSRSPNLYVAKLHTGEKVFASTETALSKACRAGSAWIQDIKQIPYDKLVKINKEDDIFKEIGDFEFGSSVSTKYVYTGNDAWGEWDGSEVDEDDDDKVYNQWLSRRACGYISPPKKVEKLLDNPPRYCYSCSELKSKNEKGFVCKSCIRIIESELRDQSSEGEGCQDVNDPDVIYNEACVLT